MTYNLLVPGTSVESLSAELLALVPAELPVKTYGEKRDDGVVYPAGPATDHTADLVVAAVLAAYRIASAKKVCMAFNLHHPHLVRVIVAKSADRQPKSPRTVGPRTPKAEALSAEAWIARLAEQGITLTTDQVAALVPAPVVEVPAEAEVPAAEEPAPAPVKRSRSRKAAA